MSSMPNDSCAYCGATDTQFHLDHVVPRSRGGPDSPDNIVKACADCNRAKSDLLPSEWVRRGASVPDAVLTIERTIAARVEVTIRSRRGARQQETPVRRFVTVENHIDAEDYYRNSPFEKARKVLDISGQRRHLDTAIYVHDTLETALSIARNLFGENVKSTDVFAIYSMLNAHFEASHKDINE